MILQPTWRLWGEEKGDGVIYTVYLKKVRYHRPTRSLSASVSYTLTSLLSSAECYQFRNYHLGFEASDISKKKKASEKAKKYARFPIVKFKSLTLLKKKKKEHFPVKQARSPRGNSFPYKKNISLRSRRDSRLYMEIFHPDRRPIFLPRDKP